MKPLQEKKKKKNPSFFHFERWLDKNYKIKDQSIANTNESILSLAIVERTCQQKIDHFII